MTKEEAVKNAESAFIAALDAGAERSSLMNSISLAVAEDCAQRKNWTMLEIEFLRKTSNRDFDKWLRDRQGKLQRTTQL
jgi:hypothetical protein